MGNKKGIDISQHQGKIIASRWADINDKCDFVIIRLGYRGSSTGKLKIDQQFQTNLASVKDLGIPYGIYFFTQARNAKEGREEADLVADNVDLSMMVYPAFIDTENSADGKGRADGISKDARTDAVKAFCDRIKERGGKAGIYSGYYWLRDQLHQYKLTGYDIWCPCYRKSCLYKGDNLTMWQTDSSNSLCIKGFGSHLDCNICYKDYTGISGSSSTQSHSAKKDYSKYVKLFQGWLGVTADGIYGPVTRKEAVKRLQELLNNLYDCGLAVDGVFGTKTKTACGCIKEGNGGSIVYLIQGLLYCHGYDPGGLDYTFGQKTKAAVRAYQESNGLTVDGIVGPKTWGSLLGTD